MSLLDDVSIVVTPNGYKAGELYAVIPVPTEGAELVTNGDFATDSDWIKNTGWTISGGSANCTSASGKSIYQTNTLIVGRQYKLNFTVSNFVSGYLGSFGNDFGGVMAQANGSYEIIGTATGTTFGIVAQGTFTGSIDNVSVKEYTSADMDVTRATAATRVDENGLVNYAEVIGGEEVTCGDFECAVPLDSWSTGTGWTISGGSANCDGTQVGTTSLIQSSVFTSGISYKITFDLTVSVGAFSLWINGTQLVQNSITSTGIKSYYVEATATGSIYFEGNVDFSGTITNISVKEVTRDNVPRIDYTGGGCPHILAEPMRTNLITYSEDFSQWIPSGTTPTLTTGQLSPSGEYNATKISGTIGSSLIYLATASSSTATRSIYARTVSGTGTARLMSYYTNSNNLFTLTEEWQRFELTGTVVNSANYYIDFRDSSQTLSEFIIWGGQSEEGYATSYIPNFGTAAGVTRNQDIFTRDGIGSLINSTEGVLFVEMAALSDGTTQREITLSDGTIDNQIKINYSSSDGYLSTRITVLGVSQAVTDIGGVVVINFNKIAVRWSENNYSLWLNGIKVFQDLSSVSVPAIGVLNSVKFSAGNNSSNFFGKVKQLQVYDTALTDEQLLQLTGESGTDFYESYAEMASALTYTIQ